jgi:hypothetical protein
MSDAIKRASEAGQQLLKALSGQMLEEWRARQFFPSTDVSDRGAVSPLGGQAKSEEKPTTKPTTNNQTEKMKW